MMKKICEDESTAIFELQFHSDAQSLCHLFFRPLALERVFGILRAFSATE